MKRIVIVFVISLISMLTFAKCDFFQIANDCNGQSITVLAKNDTISLNIHTNWNQGNISYKFQFGSEKLDILVYTNDSTKLYTELTYKNKSARMYYDFNLEQMTMEDASCTFALVQSLTPVFLASVNALVSELPTFTENLQSIADLANALVNRQPPYHPNANIFQWIAYNACVISMTYTCIGDGDFNECFDKGETACRKAWLEKTNQ